jgi:pyruvate,water dikinase
MVLATLQDGRVWKLDVTHNPDPLSPAQAGLVERVEQAGATPWSSRVCAGYLYTTPRESIAVDAPATVDELRTRVERIERRLGATLDPRGATDDRADIWSLASVLDRYVAFCRIWAYELGPLIAACRGTQPVGVGSRTSAAESALSAAAQGRVDETTVVALLGVLSPAWDVAVSTFQEQPGRVRDAIARLEGNVRRAVEPSTTTRVSIDDPSTAVLEYIALLDSLPREQPANLAEAAADLAERDDYWFAIAQWTVRRAIQQRAHDLGISTEDAFWLPLDELVGDAIDPVDATRRASGARAAAARATSWNMPIVVGAATTESGVALHGIGFGPSVTGRVRRFDSLASAIDIGRGDIVVTRAVTPALAVIVVGCAAIVSETGGLLDHGAAMARELGIPCVVGCRDAWSRLADGMIVTIDQGTVVPIASDQNVNR